MHDLYQSYFKTKTGMRDMEEKKKAKTPAYLFSTLPKMPSLKASPGFIDSNGIMNNFLCHAIHLQALLKYFQWITVSQKLDQCPQKFQRASGCVHFP